MGPHFEPILTGGQGPKEPLRRPEAWLLQKGCIVSRVPLNFAALVP